MQLNLPIQDHLASCQNVLIAGMGGGFDIFCGLPIYFEVRQRGYTVHLANFSFTQITDYMPVIRLTPSLVGVTGDMDILAPYFPEFYLARWFLEQRQEPTTLWCFAKTGVKPLLANYQTLIEHLAIDAILLIDGGVDSLARGDEANVGTILEDATSLAAVYALTHVPVRLMACLGFGAEQDIDYAHILQNIAALTQVGSFLGTCSLVQHMEAYRAYEEATLFVQAIPWQDPSVINSSVISAVQGHFGDYHLTEKTRGSSLWISPLMPIYWFFDLLPVADRSLLLPALRETETFNDVIRAGLTTLQLIPKRRGARIPLK